jgi:hypothetical protein
MKRGQRELLGRAAQVAAGVASGTAVTNTVRGRRRPRFHTLAAAGVIVIQAIYVPLVHLVNAVLREQTRAFRESARAALAGAYLELVAQGASPTALGLHAYIVRHRPIPPFRPHLLRVAKVRLGSAPPGSGIVWTQGKGVIGRCWVEDKAIVMDSAAAYAPFMTVSREEWQRQVPADVRLNLTFGEFKRIRGRYASVIAVPVRDRTGAVRGCVVADILRDAPGRVLFDDKAQATLAEAAVAVGNALTSVPTWVLP